MKKDTPVRKLWISKLKSAGGGNICRENERNVISGVVGSVARFSYKIYNCVPDNQLNAPKACEWFAIWLKCFSMALLQGWIFPVEKGTKFVFQMIQCLDLLGQISSKLAALQPRSHCYRVLYQLFYQICMGWNPIKVHDNLLLPLW